MYYRRYNSFTMDKVLGVGVRFTDGGDDKVFFENKIVDERPDDEIYQNTMNRIVDCFSSLPYYARKQQASFDRAKKTARFEFHAGGKGAINIDVTGEGEKATVSFDSRLSRYNMVYTCSCGKRDCMHVYLAGDALKREENRMASEYVRTKLPVNKALFIEPGLIDEMESVKLTGFDEETIKLLHHLADRVIESDSREYYKLFHKYIITLEPDYGYDAHLLERYEYLIYALLDNKDYYEAVIDSDYYMAQQPYEDRQCKSNKTAFKRMLKDYQNVLKTIESGKYTDQNARLEFLLKYRNDLTGLLYYYASCKYEIYNEDIPFIEKIADSGEIRFERAFSLALKLDDMGAGPYSDNGKVIAKLLSRLKDHERVSIYSQLRANTMPLEEIRKLSINDQKRMIHNTPLTAESLTHIMDNVIADEDASFKGKFLLEAADKIGNSKSKKKLSEVILKAVNELPDNGLLARFIAKKLDAYADGNQGMHVVTEDEITRYFDCNYSIENRHDELLILYSVDVPYNGRTIADVIERDGKFVVRNYIDNSIIPGETVKKIAVAGEEKKFEEEVEKEREAVDFYRFEQDNRHFANNYREFCKTLAQEKVVLAEHSKAELTYLFYRADNHNALSFKVGNSKMYIVKDAVDFLKAFKTGATEKYGKDLLLTHDPDNFIETDARVIRALLGARIVVGSHAEPKNKRFIRISDSLLGNILEQLVGRNVFFNDTPCLIRLENQKIKISIDGDYRMSLALLPGQEFFTLDGHGYILSLDKTDRYVLDRVDCTAEETGLFELVNKDPGTSISPILADFKKNIYSRFFDAFEVDPKLQNSFKMSGLKINSYFDFDDTAITVKTVFLKDEKEIKREEVTERIDVMKLAQLDDYLKNLGFTDGIMDDESRVLSFFKMDFTRLKAMTNVYLSDSLKNKEIVSLGKPVIRVTYDNNILNAFMEKTGFSEEELARIMAGLKKRKKYILLSGNRIVDISSENAKDIGETVRDFGLDPKKLYKKKTIGMVTAIKAFAHEKSCKVDKYLRDMIDEIRSFKDADIALPKLNTALRGYQEEGYKWMSILAKYHMGGVLADDMGLGKTIQVIALIKSDKTKKPSLVVCPKSLIFNWRSEFARFDDKTEVVVIYGTDAKRTEIINSIDYNKKVVYVTSYDSLRNDVSKYTGEFNYGILDEAQYIKNVNAQKTRSVKELKVDHRFALTGTPIENSVVDLWSIFDYIMPGYFDELSLFKDMDNEVIAHKAAPFILRRVKEDVLEDLPPKYERILSAEMTLGQKKLYEAMRMEAQKRLNAGDGAFDILPYLTRLRQICVDPSMFVDNYTEGSGKLSLLKEMIPEYVLAGHRILIFSSFVKALESVKTMLDELGIGYFFLSGATSADRRMEMMDAFNNGSGTDVFLISLKAGGTGLNLTGADTVIHLDPWWNVAAENQASDRAHRIGQQRNVEIIRLIADGSIEQRVVELQEIKKAVIKQVISDNDGSVVSASLEDIAYILE